VDGAYGVYSSGLGPFVRPSKCAVCNCIYLASIRGVVSLISGITGVQCWVFSKLQLLLHLLVEMNWYGVQVRRTGL